MMFCPDCGSLLKTRQQKNKPVQYCSCGYSSELKTSTTIKETINKKEDIIEVVEDHNVNPLTDETCPKCDHPKAYWWTKQTRSGDEADTKFFKCKKCKHTWRDYS
jgi:DNA-directed RNA polymerase subunit M